MNLLPAAHILHRKQLINWFRPHTSPWFASIWLRVRGAPRKFPFRSAASSMFTTLRLYSMHGEYKSNLGRGCTGSALALTVQEARSQNPFFHPFKQIHSRFVSRPRWVTTAATAASLRRHPNPEAPSTRTVLAVIARARWWRHRRCVESWSNRREYAVYGKRGN